MQGLFGGRVGILEDDAGMKRRLVIEIDSKEAICGDCEWVQEERCIHEPFCELFGIEALFMERDGEWDNFRCEQCLKAEKMYYGDNNEEASSG